MPQIPHPSRRRTVAAIASAVALTLAACGADDPDVATPTTAAATPTTASPAGGDDHPTVDSDVTEVARHMPRLALTHDGGLTVVDATTLEPVADLSLDGFNRLDDAGDGRHLVVSTDGGFRVLDLGSWSEPHGDHAHHYTAQPALTDTTYPAEEPGHVVVHDGLTALFDDGTGRVTVLPSDRLTTPSADARELTTPHAHHGVAVPLADGTLVVSEGTDEARTGIRVLGPDGAEVVASDQCPGVHGEAVAADDAVVIGCEDGALIYAGGTITKVTSPDPYGRIGNQAGSPESAVVLGDYKSDPEAELERPTRVSLIDTSTATLTLVDLPASYSFRSLGRGPHGEALVLGTDGALHVIDPATGAIERSIPVVAPWEEPLDWQQPRPTLHVADHTAYVTDPATRSLHAIHLDAGTVEASVELDVVPNEIAVATSGRQDHDHDHGSGG